MLNSKSVGTYLVCYLLSIIFIVNCYLDLDQDNCQNMSAMAPLNDLLLGQTFLIETNEQPLFEDGAEVMNFISISLLFNINIIFSFTVNYISTY